MPIKWSFKQKVAITTLNGRPLKLINKSTYLGSNISSTKSNVKICLAKAWKAIDRLPLWKSNLSDKIKQVFFSSCSRVHTTLWMHHMDTNKTERNAIWELHKNAACGFEEILEATPHKRVAVQTHAFHLTNPLSKTTKTCRVLLEKQGWTHKWNFLMNPSTLICQYWLTHKD